MSTARFVVPTDGLHPVSQPPVSDWRSRRWPIGPNGPIHPPSGQRRPPTGPGRPCPSPRRIDRYDQTRLRRRWACHLESARNQRNAAQPCRQPTWGNGRPWTDGERDENEERAPEGALSREIRRRPTLPGSLLPSTIGAGGLNFRVRNGNGCDPTAMATETFVKGAAPQRRQPALLRTPQRARTSLSIQALGRLVPVG
jgi:hypothetical protein